MHFSEERARELLFTKPPRRQELNDRIESSWFVKRPYAGILQPMRDEFHHRRFQLHPLYSEYMEEVQRDLEASYLRKRVRRMFRAIVSLKRFAMNWVAAFKHAYYMPGGGGYLKAKTRFERVE